MIKSTFIVFFFITIYYLFFQVIYQLINSKIIEIKRKPVTSFYKIKVLLFNLFCILIIFSIFINKKINSSVNSLNNSNLVKLNQEIKKVLNIWYFINDKKVNITVCFFVLFLFLSLRLLSVMLFTIYKIIFVILTRIIISVYFTPLLIVYLIILFIYFLIFIINQKQSNINKPTDEFKHNEINIEKWKHFTDLDLIKFDQVNLTKLPSLCEMELMKKGFAMIQQILYLNGNYRFNAECDLGRKATYMRQIIAYHNSELFFETKQLKKNNIIKDIKTVSAMLLPNPVFIKEGKIVYIGTNNVLREEGIYNIHGKFNLKDTEKKIIYDDFSKYGLSFKYEDSDLISFDRGTQIVNTFLKYYRLYIYNKKNKRELICYLICLGIFIAVIEEYKRVQLIILEGYNPLYKRPLTTKEINDLDFGNNPDNTLEQTFKKNLEYNRTYNFY